MCASWVTCTTAASSTGFAAVDGRVELLPTAEIALNCMLISEGIYLSNQLGREVSAGGSPDGVSFDRGGNLTATRGAASDSGIPRSVRFGLGVSTSPQVQRTVGANRIRQA